MQVDEFKLTMDAKEVSYSKKTFAYENKPKYPRKYDQHEIILDFLKSHPMDWFYIWEIMGAKRLGWVSQFGEDCRGKV